ncbi:Uncharacterised protein [uncultured archaeon]|nr:Uncharacterised protein [uncultured archaeon]
MVRNLKYCLYFACINEDCFVTAPIIQCTFNDFFCGFILIIYRRERNIFLCVYARLYFGMLDVMIGEKRKFRFAVGTRRCSHCHYPQLHELFAALLLISDCFKKLLKGRLQMSFVVNYQCVLTEKPGMKRSRLEPSAVTGKKQTASNHINCTNDYGRPRRIVPPFCIVGELAP